MKELTPERGGVERKIENRQEPSKTDRNEQKSPDLAERCAHAGILFEISGRGPEKIGDDKQPKVSYDEEPCGQCGKHTGQIERPEDYQDRWTSRSYPGSDETERHRRVDADQDRPH